MAYASFNKAETHTSFQISSNNCPNTLFDLLLNIARRWLKKTSVAWCENVVEIVNRWKKTSSVTGWNVVRHLKKRLPSLHKTSHQSFHDNYLSLAANHRLLNEKPSVAKSSEKRQPALEEKSSGTWREVIRRLMKQSPALDDKSSANGWKSSGTTLTKLDAKLNETSCGTWRNVRHLMNK